MNQLLASVLFALALVLPLVSAATPPMVVHQRDVAASEGPTPEELSFLETQAQPFFKAMTNAEKAYESLERPPFALEDRLRRLKFREDSHRTVIEKDFKKYSHAKMPLGRDLLFQHLKEDTKAANLFASDCKRQSWKEVPGRLKRKAVSYWYWALQKPLLNRQYSGPKGGQAKEELILLDARLHAFFAAFETAEASYTKLREPSPDLRHKMDQLQRTHERCINVLHENRNHPLGPRPRLRRLLNDFLEEDKKIAEEIARECQQQLQEEDDADWSDRASHTSSESDEDVSEQTPILKDDIVKDDDKS